MAISAEDKAELKRRKKEIDERSKSEEETKRKTIASKATKIKD